MQFFQHLRQGRPPHPKRDIARVVAQEEALPGPGDACPFQGNSGSPEPYQGIEESPAGTAACAD